MSTDNLQDCTNDIGYITPYDREVYAKDERVMVLTPWTVQNICYEVIKNYMIENPPQDEGYKFTQRYSPDDLESGISLEIAYHYKDAVVQKRPGIYVSRGETISSLAHRAPFSSRSLKVHGPR